MSKPTNVEKLRAELKQAESNQGKALNDKRTKAYTPKAKLLLQELSDLNFRPDSAGILTSVVTTQKYDNSKIEDRTESDITEFQKRLKSFGIKVDVAKNEKVTEGYSSDNYNDPSFSGIGSRFSYIPGHTDTIYKITIDPAQPGFEKNLQEAAISSRLDEFKKTGIKLSPEATSAIKADIVRQLDQETKAGRNK